MALHFFSPEHTFFLFLSPTCSTQVYLSLEPRVFQEGEKMSDMDNLTLYVKIALLYV